MTIKINQQVLQMKASCYLQSSALEKPSMTVKYQVFVSSTFVDLEEERRTVIEMILNMRHIPVGMEAFQASDDTQWDYIRRRIDESDYYVLIVAERYGSEQGGKSYTQMEYEYAVKIGVPVVSFLLDGSARKNWPSSKVEHDKKAKIEKFRKLCEKKLVKFWKNSDDLGAKVALALNELIRDKPRTGWVRADAVPSASVMDELARLSEEKRELQSRIKELSENDQILAIPTEVRWLINDLSQKSVSEYCKAHGVITTSVDSLLDVFFKTLPQFTSGVSDYKIAQDFKSLINGADQNEYNRDLLETIEDINREFLVANIIEKHTMQTYLFDKPSSRDEYRLTDFGKRFVMFVKELQSREIETS